MFISLLRISAPCSISCIWCSISQRSCTRPGSHSTPLMIRCFFAALEAITAQQRGRDAKELQRQREPVQKNVHNSYRHGCGNCTNRLFVADKTHCRIQCQACRQKNRKVKKKGWKPSSQKGTWYRTSTKKRPAVSFSLEAPLVINGNAGFGRNYPF